VLDDSSSRRTAASGYARVVPDFQELSDRIRELHSKGKYAQALSLLDHGHAEFPDHPATLTYWRACFESLLGDPGTALDELREGLDTGLWWAEPTLREDPDLAQVRQREGFDAVLMESGRRWREAMREWSQPTFIIPAGGDPRATLVVLQGRFGSVDDVADQWRGAADLGCTVVVPGRGQPISSDGDLSNWLDETRTDQQITTALDEVHAVGPLIVAGFSAGGREALRIGLSGSPVEAAGLLLLGPAAPREPIEARRAAQRGLRIWTLVGADDWLVDEVVATDRALREAGLDLVEIVRPDMGHVVPDDVTELLPRALDFLLKPCARL